MPFFVFRGDPFAVYIGIVVKHCISRFIYTTSKAWQLIQGFIEYRYYTLCVKWKHITSNHTQYSSRTGYHKFINKNVCLYMLRLATYLL